MTNQDVWRIALGRWDEIVSNDLHQFFGIDVGLPETMLRPWWWLRGRVLALLDVPESRLVRTLALEHGPQQTGKHSEQPQAAGSA